MTGRRRAAGGATRRRGGVLLRGARIYPGTGSVDPVVTGTSALVRSSGVGFIVIHYQVEAPIACLVRGR